MKKLSTMLYFLNGDEVLFLVRDNQNDKIHSKGVHVSIGGKIEPGEGIEEAAIREVFEESGINLSHEDIQLRGIIHYKSADADGDDWVNFLFISNKKIDTPEAGDEGSFAWVHKNDFDKINLYERDKVFFECLFKSQFFVLEFTYRGKETLGHKVLKFI